MRYRSSVPLVLLSASIAVFCSAPAGAALPPKAPIPYRPITVSDLPGATVDQDLAPDQRAKAAHDLHTYSAPSESMKFGASSQATFVTTRSGQRVNTRALSIYLNDVERRLNHIGYTLRDPALTDVDLDQIYGPAVSRPGPLTPNMRFGAPRIRSTTGPPRAGLLPSISGEQNIGPAGTGPQPACPPGAPNLASTWKSLNDLAKGGTLKRGDLAFGCKLAAAEAQPPLLPSSLQYQTPPFLYGNNYAQAALQNSVIFKGDAKSSAIEYAATVTASVLGKTFNVADLDSTFTAPTNGDATAVIDLKIGQISAYHTSGTFKTLELNFVPNQELLVVPPYKASFDVGAGFRANFEVDCKAKYGLNGHVEASPVGLYLDTKPNVSLTITGALGLDGIFLQGGINGTLKLVDFNGEFGGISALFADTTATGVSGAPIVSVNRPIATYSINPLSGSIEAYLYPALVRWPKLHRTIPITFTGIKPVSHALVDGDWTVRYVMPGSSPKR